MGYRVGVDIGGTFTDFCVFDEATGTLETLKVLSRPDNPGAEVIDGLKAIEERYSIPPKQINYFTHGTTVGVNTVIQRKGARLCLFTTENFEDVLEVARLKMPDPYDLFSCRVEPLVTRDKVFGIRERVLADEESVRGAIEKARNLRAEVIIVALLHAYVNPEHERWVAEVIRLEAPEMDVLISSEVWPVIREYERTITATVAGYVRPQVVRYLSSLQSALKKLGVFTEPMITKSNGGVMSAEIAKTHCAQMLLSGTASGVMGAASIARQVEANIAMSLDIGGTSADVAIIESSQPQYGTGEMVGEFPIYIPTVSVTSIGEGGGSIAWIDDLGILKVGPESAGSYPGPACYAKGGVQPTITDALVVMGFLGQIPLGYKSVDIRPELSTNAIEPLAKLLGVNLLRAAEDIIHVAISRMYLELSKMISRNGIDPRELSLIAFGGAGPMLACWLVKEFDMKEVIIPKIPGVLSALGGLIADVKNDFIRTVYLDLDKTAVMSLQEGFGELARKAMRWIREEQGFEEEVAMLTSADMRYRGQSYEIDIPLEPIWIEQGDIISIEKAFHELHEKVYSHSDSRAAVQIINLRLVIVGEPVKPKFSPTSVKETPLIADGNIKVFCENNLHVADIYSRTNLLSGHGFAGPAIVFQEDCTTCILPGFVSKVDPYGNLIVSLKK